MGCFIHFGSVLSHLIINFSAPCSVLTILYLFVCFLFQQTLQAVSSSCLLTVILLVCPASDFFVTIIPESQPTSSPPTVIWIS